MQKGIPSKQTIVNHQRTQSQLGANNSVLINRCKEFLQNMHAIKKWIKFQKHHHSFFYIIIWEDISLYRASTRAFWFFFTNVFFNYMYFTEVLSFDYISESYSFSLYALQYWMVVFIHSVFVSRLLFNLCNAIACLSFDSLIIHDKYIYIWTYHI